MAEVNFPRVLGLLEVVIKSADFNFPNIRAAALEELKQIEDELKPDPIEFRANVPFPPEPSRPIVMAGAHDPTGPAGFTDAAGNVIEGDPAQPEPLTPAPEEPVERRV